MSDRTRRTLWDGIKKRAKKPFLKKRENTAYVPGDLGKKTNDYSINYNQYGNP